MSTGAATRAAVESCAAAGTAPTPAKHMTTPHARRAQGEKLGIRWEGCEKSVASRPSSDTAVTKRSILCDDRHSREPHRAQLHASRCHAPSFEPPSNRNRL